MVLFMLKVHYENGSENEHEDEPHVANGFAVNVHSEDEHEDEEPVVIINEPESESENEPEDEPLNEPINEPLVVNGFPAHIYSDNESENGQEDEQVIINGVIVNEPDDEPPNFNIPERESEDEQEDGTVNEPQDNILPEMKEISEDAWNQMIEKVTLKKVKMDTLVMDYLVNRELPEVAQAFHRETGCPRTILNHCCFFSLFLISSQLIEYINL